MMMASEETSEGPKKLAESFLAEAPQRLCEALIYLNDGHFEAYWDEIDRLIQQQRSSFSEQEVECCLDILGRLSYNSAAADTALYVLRQADPSGELLAKGIMRAFTTDSAYSYGHILSASHYLPTVLPPEFKGLHEGYVRRIGKFSSFWMRPIASLRFASKIKRSVELFGHKPKY